MTLRLFTVAGEASGDALGAALLGGLDTLAPGWSATGIAGPRMRERGAGTLFPMEELAVMGLAEVVPRLPRLLRRLRQTVEACLDADPDALLTIDAPDFALRVAARVKAARPDLPVVHYVAPSVWAWRPGRAATMARHVDHVLALLPFEPPYMRAAGMTCDFVGHPAAAEPPADAAEVARLRGAHGMGGDAVLILPGSRAGEVARLGPTLGRAAGPAVRAGLTPVVPVAPGRMADVRAAAGEWPFVPVLIDATDPAVRRAAMAGARGAVAASGTVSLDLARAGVPMVIGYDVHPVTRMVMRRMMRTDTVTLVNLVSGTRAVPEFVGGAFRSAPMAAALEEVLADPAPQRAAMAETMRRLGRGGEAPGLRAARSLLGAVERGPRPR